MIIGVPKEIKAYEERVGLVPHCVRELTLLGHQVLIETQAGVAIGFSNADYKNAGAVIISNAKEVFTRSEMIVKVKEPQTEERVMLSRGQILFTYLHLAPDITQTKSLIDSKAICIAYESVTDSLGKCPLLAPMSAIAGRMSIQAGAQSLEHSHGGKGLLVCGVPGVEAARIVILGGGMVGANAARMALGWQAEVTLLDNNLATLAALDREFAGQVTLLYATHETIDKLVSRADIIVGAVRSPNATPPMMLTADHLPMMQPGSVLVDVSIDQGGCFETSRPTSHSQPTYLVDNIVHYCVPNMPSAVARTASFALSNATLPYIKAIANKGYKKALMDDEGFLNGMNLIHGKVTNKAIATHFDLHYTRPTVALSMH
ncbi:alanine dehydrogenase [Photobacterium aphoticum]|uniref:Alanine dehydrogenase n=2 Tax=Photobacterium aphoticum TaxID=754436 RepID=A0A0J1GTA8_9GAMM|nr:alanine dehydrogenase [Photobacterium aphoticum]KLV02963.1 alanine dehydrogenase [Photobacterium aphoticum]PSU49697.1 alanine dehydrogenase [Photobacterium aphoticum]GHA67024.1 alanine dehydrogenase [Photobacterium aphoticum]